MNGVHDMGGMHGFGAVAVDDDAEFHADWERLVFAMDRAVRAQDIVNIDEKRHGIERMAPGAYLSASYFERWLTGLTINLADAGVLEPSELDDRLDALLAADAPRELVPDRTDPDLAAAIRDSFAGDAAFDRAAPEPAFEEGEQVRVKNHHPAGHTRCPRYARRAVGTITASRGPFVYPDANAHGAERAEPLYTVGFSGEELWGPEAESPADTIHIDLWEPYVEAV